MELLKQTVEDHEERLNDHEERIRSNEKTLTIFVTKLNLMIGILAAIATMVGGAILAKVF